MSDSIESLIKELISKVDSCQPVIDDLNNQVQDLSDRLATKESECEAILCQARALEEKLEYYFLLCKDRLEVIKNGEDLQGRAIKALVDFNSVIDKE